MGQRRCVCRAVRHRDASSSLFLRFELLRFLKACCPARTDNGYHRNVRSIEPYPGHGLGSSDRKTADFRHASPARSDRCGSLTFRQDQVALCADEGTDSGEASDFGCGILDEQRGEFAPRVHPRAELSALHVEAVEHHHLVPNSYKILDKPRVATGRNLHPVLAGDGSDVGAAVQTIIDIGDAETMRDAIADAFDSAKIGGGHRFEVEMRQHGLLRPLSAAERSDGALRYNLLAAALLSPRAPELMILNEPEASLHPDLLALLARLRFMASKRCQIIVLSHAQKLVSALGSGLIARTGRWQRARRRRGRQSGTCRSVLRRASSL
jgi:hypothetical protein